jgi:hypothetical protein
MIYLVCETGFDFAANTNRADLWTLPLALRSWTHFLSKHLSLSFIADNL